MPHNLGGYGSWGKDRYAFASVLHPEGVSNRNFLVSHCDCYYLPSPSPIPQSHIWWLGTLFQEAPPPPHAAFVPVINDRGPQSRKMPCVRHFCIKVAHVISVVSWTVTKLIHWLFFHKLSNLSFLPLALQAPNKRALQDVCGSREGSWNSSWAWFMVKLWMVWEYAHLNALWHTSLR